MMSWKSIELGFRILISFTVAFSVMAKELPKVQKADKVDEDKEWTSVLNLPCTKAAKLKVERKFHKKVVLGNYLKEDGLYAFVLQGADGCDYIVSIGNTAKTDGCKLTDPEKADQPSRCPGE